MPGIMQLTKHWAAQLDDYAIDLAWSPDGNQLAAASSAGSIALFAGADGAKLHELPGHKDGTNVIAFRPTTAHGASLTHTLASGGQDGAVKFWDTTAGQHTATAELGAAWVEPLAWRPSPGARDDGSSDSASTTLFAAAGKDLFVLRADGSVAHQFKPAPKSISALAF